MSNPRTNSWSPVRAGCSLTIYPFKLVFFGFLQACNLHPLRLSVGAAVWFLMVSGFRKDAPTAAVVTASCTASPTSSIKTVVRYMLCTPDTCGLVLAYTQRHETCCREAWLLLSCGNGVVSRLLWQPCEFVFFSAVHSPTEVFFGWMEGGFFFSLGVDGLPTPSSQAPVQKLCRYTLFIRKTKTSITGVRVNSHRVWMQLWMARSFEIRGFYSKMRNIVTTINSSADNNDIL